MKNKIIPLILIVLPVVGIAQDCNTAITAPYTESFETFTTSQLAFVSEHCWTAPVAATNYYWESASGIDLGSNRTGPDPSITTGNYFYTEASSSSVGDVTELVSPLVNLSTLVAPELTFNYHMFGDRIGTLEVLVNDSTTPVWSLSGEQQTSATQNWELAVIDLAAYAGQSITITFRATSAGTFEGDIAIDNVSFIDFTMCDDTLTPLTVTGITNTTADLGWTENGTATSWDLEIVTSGTTPTGTPTQAGITTSPYTAMNLTPETAYDFYVRADCGIDGTSTWAGPFTFTTACTPIAAPYIENFETFTTSELAFDSEHCWSAPVPPTNYFWESASGEDLGSFDTGPNPSITTGNYFYTEASFSSVGDVAELVSPLVNLSTVAPELTFNYHMFGDQIGTLEVLVNDSTTPVWSLSGEQQTSPTQDWELAYIDLAAYAGQSITVTFRATSAGTFEGDIAIDNVSFTELSCIPPSTLTATNILDTTADLSWTQNGTATASWDVEIVTSGTAPTGIPTASGVTNPYTATNLSPETAYDFYVRANCGSGVTSAWTSYFTFETECLRIMAPYTEDFETFTTTNGRFTEEHCWTTEGFTGIDWRVASGTYQGTTTPDPSITTGNYFYTHPVLGPAGYVSSLISPIVDMSGLSSPALTFNYHMFGLNTGTLEVLVNGSDTVWSLSGEQQETAIDPWGFAIIDLAAYAGQTIRVTFRGTKAQHSSEEFVIDNVSFTELPCLPPTALTATNILDTTADLSWTQNDSATAWDVEIVTSGTAPTGTPTASGVTNPYTATNLNPDTAYDFYVRADCGAGELSVWAGPFTFETLCTPIIAPYTEHFETFTTANGSFVEGNCWEALSPPYGYFWRSAPNDNGLENTGPAPSISTGNRFHTLATNGDDGITTDLVLPHVDVSALGTPALMFNYHMYGSDIGTLEVLVNGTTTIWSLSGQQQVSATTPWELAVIDLSAYAGQTIRVTFRAIKAGGSNAYHGSIAIDNISFTELSTCLPPVTLTATNITGTTADLGWTEIGTATAWDIEIVPSGTIATGIPTASGVTNPYTATNLSPETAYDFYVRANCGANEASAWIGPFTFNTLQIVDLQLQLKVILQGPSLVPQTTGLMNDILRADGQLPIQSPYGDAAVIDSSILNTGGTSGSGDNNDDIVDWVWIELRDGNDAGNLVASSSALLQRDGDVVGLDGISNLTFSGLASTYYVVVKHRNHLGVMTQNPVSLSETVTIIDFTDAATATYGSNAQVQLPSGSMALWAGNVNGDAAVQYSGTNPDSPSILSEVLNHPGNFLNFPTYVASGYNTHDINMDGNTQYTGTTPDTTILLQNILAHPGNFLNFSTYQILEQLPEN